MSRIGAFAYGAIGALLGPGAEARAHAMRIAQRARSGGYDRDLGWAVIRRFVKRADVVIDVGASYGKFSFMLAEAVGADGTVHAIEPTSLGAQSVKRIATRYDMPQLLVHELALGDTCREDSMMVPGRVYQRSFLASRASGASPFDSQRMKKIRVRVHTLDSFAENNGLTRIDFMKIDVEGAELELFRGGSDTLRAYRPLIFCEIEDRHTRKYGHRAVDVFTYLSAMGYQAHVLLDGEIVVVERPRPDSNDYLLIPTPDETTKVVE